MLDNDQPASHITAQASGGELLLLDKLSIPGAAIKPLPSGELGINRAAAQENFPKNGLQLYVPAWSKMDRGDKVRILLGRDEVDSKTITEELVDHRQTLFVPPAHLQTGSAEISYAVKRLGQTEEPSEATSIYIKLERPGGQDQDGSKPGHSELKFALPDDVKDVVDKERAKEGVEVTIQPYPEMAEGDTVRLTWGGVFVSHTVTQEEVDNSFKILVEEAVILKAGDSDAKGLAVAFEVYDLVDNRSEDWSAEQRVVVDTDSARLSAGIVKEAKNNVLDLETLGNADATFQVVASGEPFALGDTVVANLSGETEDGRLVDITYEGRVLDSVPGVAEIKILHGDVRQLAKTQAKFSYELVKSEAVLRAMDAQALQRYEQELTEGVYKSKGQFVTIVGEPVRLAAPMALDAEQGTLDPALAETTVEVPWDASMQAGDVITLIWEGEKPDYEPYFPEIAPHDISSGEAERKQPISFVVQGKHLKAIEGGKLVLLYMLEQDGQLPRRSERTESYSVGEPRAELPAPSVTHAEEGVLDPEKVPVGGTKLVMPRYPGIEVGDVLCFRWQGKSDDASMEDSIRITSSNIDRKQFDPTIAKKLVTDNDGHEVVVSYWVQRTDETTSHSEPLTLQVGAVVPALPELVIEEVTEDGQLDPDQLTNGATVLIDARAQLKADDKVRIKVTGKYKDEQTHPVTKDGEQRFKIGPEVIMGNEGSTITVTYSIQRDGAEEVRSPDVQFTVLERRKRLPALTIEQASEQGVIDPEDILKDATAHISGDARWEVGNYVIIYVKGKHPGRLFHSVTQAGEQTFAIDRKMIVNNEDSDITITYDVVRGEGEPLESSYPATFKVLERSWPSLPKPVLKEASAQGVIDPEHVKDGATVVIDKSAELSPGDQVTIVVTGKFPYEQKHPVSQEGEQTFTIDYDAIKKNEESEIELKYIVLRDGKQKEEKSETVIYDVWSNLGEGTLKVFGARYTRSSCRAFHAPRHLHAYGAETGEPIMALWRYCAGTDDCAWTSAEVWRDSHPHLPLQVRTQSSLVTLNPANIIGNGVYAVKPPAKTSVNDTTGTAAFVALRNDGRVRGWGKPENGGKIPAPIKTFDDIVEVSCANDAYAARRVDGSVVVWGNGANGGSLGDVSPQGFSEVIANGRAFAGLKASGSVVGWGLADAGSLVPEPISALTDIVRVAAAGDAFAALRESGHVVGWGSQELGGKVPESIRLMNDIVDIVGNQHAFAARRGNRTLVAWGGAKFGGAADAVAEYTDIAQLCGASDKAFVAQRATGQLVAWGDKDAGGLITEEIKDLIDIIEVVSTSAAFAAVRRAGSVVAWGTEASGGKMPDEIKKLTNVVQVVGSAHAFAVLSHDGTVKAWGNTAVGGNTASVADELHNIQALYANALGFVALREDGKVITWGDNAGGGDSSSVSDQINNFVTYHATPASRGRALMALRRQTALTTMK